MKRLALLLLLSVSCIAQSPKPATKPVRKPTVYERLDKLESSLQETAKSRDDLREENERLKAANKELSDSNIAIAAKYEELRKSAAEVLQFGLKASTEYDKSTSANAELVNKYNALLFQANFMIKQQNERLSQQARINNAFAIYSMMPKYTPVQIPVPTVPQTLNVNVQTTCTSNTIGNATYSTCR